MMADAAQEEIRNAFLPQNAWFESVHQSTLHRSLRLVTHYIPRKFGAQVSVLAVHHKRVQSS